MIQQIALGTVGFFAFCVTYTYALYPALLYIGGAGRRKQTNTPADAALPSVHLTLLPEAVEA